MDWIDTVFYPQDLFGDILNYASNAVQQVESTAGQEVQQVEQGVGYVAGAASDAVQQVQQAAGSVGQGVQQVIQEAGSIGQGIQQQVQTVEQTVSSVAQQQVQATQQQASQVLNLLSEAPSELAGTLQQATSTGNTAVVNLVRSAQNEAAAAAGVAAVQSNAASALAALSAGIPRAAAAIVTGTVKAAVSGAASVAAPAAPVTGFLGSLGTTVVAGAAGELAGASRAGAQVESQVPVFQDIYNAGLETMNVAKNIVSGQPVLNGITTGTVVETAPGVSKGNITVNALQNAATSANALPGVNTKLFESIAGPNANPVVLTGAQILDFTIQHPLETTLAVAGAAETGGAALDLLAPGEAGAETAAEEAITSAGENSTLEETIIGNPNAETTLTEDVSNISQGGDATAAEACGF